MTIKGVVPEVGRDTRQPVGPLRVLAAAVGGVLITELVVLTMVALAWLIYIIAVAF